MAGQAEKALRFRALHEAPGVLLLPNPWDVASTEICPMIDVS